ncbi:MAG: hypothetical protein Q7K35_02305 [bacterium]|nr:hypothetical protein [bacterium]
MGIFSLILILKIVLAIVIIGSLIFFFLAAFSIYTNLTTGVPWAKNSRENFDKIFKEINLPKNFLLYDLGSGDGRALFIAEKYGCRAVGYELSLYPYMKAWFRKVASRSSVILKRKNFFQEDLSRADAVFVFLVGKVMDRVGRKLKTELKKGVIVVSYGFSIPGWSVEKTLATKPSLTYIYKI